MYVIIAGAGLVGGNLAARLVERGHDVVVVDSSRERCEEVYSEIGAVSINGSATNVGVLEEAGIERAQVTVGMMREDADNLAFTLIARSFNVPRRFVRMRDPRYGEAYQLAGATYVLGVVDLYMQRLMPVLERPLVRSICELADGSAEVVAITLPARNPWSDKQVSVDRFVRQSPGFAFLTGLVKADGGIKPPHGEAPLEEGDELIFVCSGGELSALADYVLGKVS